MTDLAHILSGFAPASLEDLEGGSLRARSDHKFMLPAAALPELLGALKPYYKALFIQNNAIFAYRNQYFDTPGFAMYLAHHNGRLARVKIRQRTYLETAKAYLEVKIKSNTGKTEKHRLPVEAHDSSWPERAARFIASKTPYQPQTLLPVLTVTYNRITLLDRSSGEKITLDMEIVFSGDHARFKLNNLVLVEVKQLHRAQSPVLNILESRKIRPASFSKYCTGINYLFPHLKKNNFKQKITRLNKLLYEPAIANI